MERLNPQVLRSVRDVDMGHVSKREIQRRRGKKGREKRMGKVGYRMCGAVVWRNAWNFEESCVLVDVVEQGDSKMCFIPSGKKSLK